jgi:hypothetical protein
VLNAAAEGCVAACDGRKKEARKAEALRAQVLPASLDKSCLKNANYVEH